MSNVPAGWYPNPQDPTQTRYWDGAQWTSHVAPAAVPEPAPTPAPQLPAPAPVAAPQFSPPPAGPAFSTVAPAGTATGSSSRKKWLIGGAIAAGVIVVGSVGAAIGSGGRTDAAPEASTAPVSVPTSTPAPEEIVETTAPEAPVIEAVDAVAFRAQAGSHLDDMLKDLDDIIVTVNEDGFWRLLSNSGELAFNQAQLESLEVPENVAATWPTSLNALQSTQDVLAEAIDTQDGPTILAAVETVRAQVEASRGVVNTAQ